MTIQNSFHKFTLKMLVEVFKFPFMQPDFNINNKNHAKALSNFNLNSQGLDSVPLTFCQGKHHTEGQWIVISENLHQWTLAITHEHHQGIVKTKAHLREKLWWPRIDRQVELLINSCLAFQVTVQSTVKCKPLKIVRNSKISLGSECS